MPWHERIAVAHYGMAHGAFDLRIPEEQNGKALIYGGKLQDVVELRGFEPLASSLRTRRSPN